MSENTRPLDLQQEKSDTLLYELLSEAYTANQLLVKLLPKLAKVSVSSELTATFDLYTSQTEESLRDLRKIFMLLGQKPKDMATPMEKLILEISALMEDQGKDTTAHDLGLVCKAKEIESYQIRLFSIIYNIARSCGFVKIADLLMKAVRNESERQSVLARMEKNLSDSQEQ